MASISKRIEQLERAALHRSKRDEGPCVQTDLEACGAEFEAFMFNRPIEPFAFAEFDRSLRNLPTER